MITAIDVIKHMKYRTRRSIAINFVLLCIGLICGYYMKEILHSFKTALVHNNTNKSKLGFFESIEREEASSNSDGNGNTILGTNRRITTETDEKRTELFKVLKNYETTMRSCLGFYCFDDPVQLEGNVKIVRIGILSPYDKNSKLVEDMMKIINNNSNKIGSDSNNKVHSIEFVRDTHVPAYGYGKNHGWSRIIRIVGILPEEATQILANAGISSSNDNYQQLYASQVKQLMRWHCRLSHVAAHTAMLTVFMDDLLTRPAFALQEIITFIGHKASREMIQNTISAIKNANTVFFDSSADRKPDISETTMDIAIQAINEEMSKSKELTKWPCLSFRDIDKDSSNGLPLKASKLAADCNSKYVKCTVPYDLRGG